MWTTSTHIYTRQQENMYVKGTTKARMICSSRCMNDWNWPVYKKWRLEKQHRKLSLQRYTTMARRETLWRTRATLDTHNTFLALLHESGVQERLWSFYVSSKILAVQQPWLHPRTSGFHPSHSIRRSTKLHAKDTARIHAPDLKNIPKTLPPLTTT